MGEQLQVIDELEQRLLDACYRRAPAWHQRLRDPRALVPATLASAAAGTGMAIVLLAGGGVAPSLAQAALNKAARAAASAPSTALLPGRDWYVRALITNTSAFPLLATGGPVAAGPGAVPVIMHTVEEVWMTRDGASHSRSRITFAFANPRAAARHGQKLPRPQTEIIGTPPNGLLSSPLGQSHLISYQQLRALPASVAGLTRVIRQIQVRLRIGPAPVAAQTPTTPPRSSTSAPLATPTTPAAPLATTSPQAPAAPRAVASPTFNALRVISWLLAMPVPAAVRAALYRTAASLPGVHYGGAADDPLGRSGVEISARSGSAQLRMIFDPRSGQLLSTATSYGAAARERGLGPLVETIVTEKIVADASRPASTRARRRG